MSSFIQGLALAFTGFRTATRSKPLRLAYLRYVAAVLALALVFEALAAYALREHVPAWVDQASQWASVDVTPQADPSWWTRTLTWLGRAEAATVRGVAWTLAIVGWLIAAILAPYLAFVLINAVLPMFNEAIFMGALQDVDVPLHADLELREGRPFWTSFSYSMLRLSRFLAGTVAIALLGLIPVIGTVLSPVLSAVWTALNLSWELLEPYFDRRGDDWSGQRKLLAKHRNLRLGFSTPVALLLAIPIVGVFFFAMAQASAAGLASRIEGHALDVET